MRTHIFTLSALVAGLTILVSGFDAQGAITAAQLFQAASQHVEGMTECLAAGDFAPVVSWLREHVHSLGRSIPTASIVSQATGASLGTTAFLAHLERRYVR